MATRSTMVVIDGVCPLRTIQRLCIDHVNSESKEKEEDWQEKKEMSLKNKKKIDAGIYPRIYKYIIDPALQYKRRRGR